MPACVASSRRPRLPPLLLVSLPPRSLIFSVHPARRRCGWPRVRVRVRHCPPLVLRHVRQCAPTPAPPSPAAAAAHRWLSLFVFPVSFPFSLSTARRACAHVQGHTRIRTHACLRAAPCGCVSACPHNALRRSPSSPFTVFLFLFSCLLTPPASIRVISLFSLCVCVLFSFLPVGVVSSYFLLCLLWRATRAVSVAACLCVCAAQTLTRSLLFFFFLIFVFLSFSCSRCSSSSFQLPHTPRHVALRFLSAVVWTTHRRAWCAVLPSTPPLKRTRTPAVRPPPLHP